jgi:hypothetical protein
MSTRAIVIKFVDGARYEFLGFAGLERIAEFVAPMSSIR